MIPAPQTYEEWLALSPEDRRMVHFNVWSTYARDGVAIAYTAAARLALTCGRKVLNIEIGTYHGGEYLLHMKVSAEEFKNCPRMLEDEFEGFRVAWMPAFDFAPPDESGATLEGSWISDDGFYEFDFLGSASGLVVSGRIGGSDSEVWIDHPNLSGQFVMFSAFDPERGTTTRHNFRLLEPDVAEDDLTFPRKFIRKLGQGANQGGRARTSPPPET